MDASLAARLVDLISDNVDRMWPYKTGYVLYGPASVAAPRRHTPVFSGCFDWHSAVHSHWALARLCRAYPAAPWNPAAQAVLDRRLTAPGLAAEAGFLAANPGFEQPYGVAWLLVLCAELEAMPAFAGRACELEGLARRQFVDWLERLPGPIRSGQHSQTAFAMGLALDAARARGEDRAARAIERAALEFYADDVDAPIAYEPSAHDFLSPALAEAELMARVMERPAFASWLAGFLPDPVFRPVTSVDPADGKLAHASGLNLSRAWMLRRIAAHLAPGPQRAAFHRCAGDHSARLWRAHRDAPYAETHWLPSFVVYHELSAIS